VAERQTLYFGSPDRRDGGHTVRALRAYLHDRESIARSRPDRHQGRLFLARDGWPLTDAGVRSTFERLGKDASLPNVIPHRFRHTFATMYLVRHPGDETGLRGILGHLSDDMFRTYTHISSELIAQRAGRVSLSEAWLGNSEAEIPYQRPPRQQPAPVPASSARVDLEAIAAAIKGDPELRHFQYEALLFAGDRQVAQDVVEYGMIIGTIAMVVLLGVAAFGSQIGPWFERLAAHITTVGT
jgi:Flp pilus assembly pilin Flp